MWVNTASDSVFRWSLPNPVLQQRTSFGRVPTTSTDNCRNQSSSTQRPTVRKDGRWSFRRIRRYVHPFSTRLLVSFHKWTSGLFEPLLVDEICVLDLHEDGEDRTGTLNRGAGPVQVLTISRTMLDPKTSFHSSLLTNKFKVTVVKDRTTGNCSVD